MANMFGFDLVEGSWRPPEPGPQMIDGQLITHAIIIESPGATGANPGDLNYEIGQAIVGSIVQTLGKDQVRIIPTKKDRQENFDHITNALKEDQDDENEGFLYIAGSDGSLHHNLPAIRAAGYDDTAIMMSALGLAHDLSSMLLGRDREKLFPVILDRLRRTKLPTMDVTVTSDEGQQTIETIYVVSNGVVALASNKLNSPEYRGNPSSQRPIRRRPLQARIIRKAFEESGLLDTEKDGQPLEDGGLTLVVNGNRTIEFGRTPIRLEDPDLFRLSIKDRSQLPAQLIRFLFRRVLKGEVIPGDTLTKFLPTTDPNSKTGQKIIQCDGEIYEVPDDSIISAAHSGNHLTFYTTKNPKKK